jgi:hypothetical protein
MFKNYQKAFRIQVYKTSPLILLLAFHSITRLEFKFSKFILIMIAVSLAYLTMV